MAQNPVQDGSGNGGIGVQRKLLCYHCSSIPKIDRIKYPPIKKIPTLFIADARIYMELYIGNLFSEMIFRTRCLFKLETEKGGCVSFLLDILSGMGGINLVQHPIFSYY